MNNCIDCIKSWSVKAEGRPAQLALGRAATTGEPLACQAWTVAVVLPITVVSWPGAQRFWAHGTTFLSLTAAREPCP
jgi:hypothetical protein